MGDFALARVSVLQIHDDIQGRHSMIDYGPNQECPQVILKFGLKKLKTAGRTWTFSAAFLASSGGDLQPLNLRGVELAAAFREDSCIPRKRRCEEHSTVADVLRRELLVDEGRGDVPVLPLAGLGISPSTPGRGKPHEIAINLDLREGLAKHDPTLDFLDVSADQVVTH